MEAPGALLDKNREARQQQLAILQRILCPETMGESQRAFGEAMQKKIPTVKAFMWGHCAAGTGYLKGPRINYTEDVLRAVQARIGKEADPEVKESLQTWAARLDLEVFARPDPKVLREAREAAQAASGPKRRKRGQSLEAPAPEACPAPSDQRGALQPRSASPGANGVLAAFFTSEGVPANVIVARDARGNAFLVQSTPGTEVRVSHTKEGGVKISTHPATDGDD